MLPGVQHCAGGPGADSFGQPGAAEATDPQQSVTLALEQWVEKGVAPSTIIASKFAADDAGKGARITRPLCPYPQAAKYKGAGDPNNAANFVCAPPTP
jgi:feruloyl esterase